MTIPFWKMHGAGNDFILVDDRDRGFPTESSEWLRSVARRRTGVGCDGVILIQPSDRADFHMRFFNPDGNEVDMCGNGARCVARLAHEIGAAPASMSIDTAAGVLRAEIVGELVRLHMTDPVDWAMGQALTVGGEELAYGFVNTGVEHAVTDVGDRLPTLDVQTLGSAIRYHEQFAPKGTNANFIRVTGPQSLEVRTYERGVEAETLACGTGMVACGLVAARLDLVTAPVAVTCKNGDELQVDFTLADDSARDVTLTGPAAHVFKGELDPA